MSTNGRTVDDYLSGLPESERSTLERLRKTIKSIVPDATEVISYQIPTFRYQGRPLVGFGATREHCTLFLMSTAIIGAFKDDLKGYEVGRGSIKFRAEKPLPYSLVSKLVKARIAENLELDKKAHERKRRA
jgi:uncharacterized protein YdhG (YjbR/CyaY superfamily)